MDYLHVQVDNPWYNYYLSQDSPLDILRVYRLYVPHTITFLSLNINFAFANSADPDEMPPITGDISSGSSLFTKVPV